MMQLLIASGAYVTPELEAEFGPMPPSFLPIGNRRLLEWQLSLDTKRFSSVHITLPEDFDLLPSDAQMITSAGASVIRVDPTWPLARSIAHALSSIPGLDELTILYGDTLLKQWPSTSLTDWIGVGQPTDHYAWHYESATQARPTSAWVGAFRFSQAHALLDLLGEHNSFIDAVTAYMGGRPDAGRVDVADWLDFGHVHTYYKSRTHMTTERAFNDLRITDGVVMKRSRNTSKMIAESGWLENAPLSVKRFMPAYYGRLHESGQVVGYAIEYLPYPSLSDLFVFGQLPANAWESIFRSCRAFLDTLLSLETPSFDLEAYSREIYEHKTWDRLTAFAEQQHLDLDAPWQFNGRSLPSLRDMASECITHVLSSRAGRASVVHGDLCFSNILFDFRSGCIRTIDPRGLNFRDEPSMHGDVRYDIAKLFHSVVGLYDHIVADRFTLEIDGYQLSLTIHAAHTDDIQAAFQRVMSDAPNLLQGDEWPITILLFLSMLPLHHDSLRRQRGMMANAMRLYAQWKGLMT